NVPSRVPSVLHTSLVALWTKNTVRPALAMHRPSIPNGKVPVIVPSALQMRYRRRVVKYSDPRTTALPPPDQFSDSGGGLPLRSFVPSAVPSLPHILNPSRPSLAAKKTRPWITANKAGLDPFSPDRMSLTMIVPTSVPSLIHNS